MSVGDEVIYLDVDGLKRRYVLHRPPGFDPARLYPAVLMLDGRGGTPWTAMKSTGWSAHADEQGFLAVYPEALRLRPEAPMHFLTNPQMWNAGPGGSDTERTGADDVAFLRAVMADLRTCRGADPRRIFLAGFSNGAAMCFRFAATEPDLVAALAPVAGHFRFPLAALSRPVPATVFFGRLDPLSPYEGGPVELPWGAREERPAARASVLAWARLCGLGHEPTDLQQGAGFTLERFGPSPAGAEVLFYTIEEGGHTWPGGHRLLPEAIAGRTSTCVNATAASWSFFQRHPLP
jgi:polyhydroxybutyrate depolymerase